LTFPLFLFKLFMGLGEAGDQMNVSVDDEKKSIYKADDEKKSIDKKSEDDVEKVVRYTIRVRGEQTGGVKINVHQVTKGDVDNPDEQVCTPLNTSPPPAQEKVPIETKPASPAAGEKQENIVKQKRKKAKVSPKKENAATEKSQAATTPNKFPAASKLKAQLYKTELCRSWRYAGSCRYLNKCKFAHGLPDLRPVQRSRKYKTQLCNKWSTYGFCPYGDRCQFLHGMQVGFSTMPAPYTPPRKMPMQMIQRAPMIPFLPINTIPFLMSPSMPSPPPHFDSTEKRMKNCMITSPPFLRVDPMTVAEVEERTAAEVAHSAYDELHDIDTQIESLEDAKIKIMLAKTQNIMHQAIQSPQPKMRMNQVSMKASPQIPLLPPTEPYITQQPMNFPESGNNIVPANFIPGHDINYQDNNVPTNVPLTPTLNECQQHAIDFVPQQE